MCGIIGVAGKSLDKNFLAKLRDMMAHRGPDAAGEYSNKNVYLGHRRLSILDLSPNANQPFQTDSGHLHFVGNGEIYNYLELRQQLKDKGHIFKSDSDNEVILHAYKEWGVKCLDNLLGMFAFIIWDDEKKELFAARDHAGIKPLYALPMPNGIALSSECSPLVMLAPEKKLNRLALSYFLTLGYVPAPLSIWDKIIKIEAGQALFWSEAKGLRLFRYWSPPAYIDDMSRHNEWDDLFQTVTAQHLQADVPVGLYLSAGLDSSSICNAVNRMQKKLQTLTVGFEDESDDESKIARQTAANFNMPCETIYMRINKVDELLQHTCMVYDEPLAYGSLLNTLLLCQHTTDYCKVVLSGDGGDETLGGYNWYNLTYTKKSTLRSLFKKSTSAFHNLPTAMQEFPKRSPLHQHAWAVFPRFLPEEASYLIFNNPKIFTDEKMLAPLESWYEPSLPLKRAKQRIDLMTFSSDVCLPKMDRASMYASLEVRVPFLDKRIIEWGLTRPMTQEYEQKPKQILCTYLQGCVPQEVLTRPKQGFSLRALSNYDFNAALDGIANSKLVRDGILHPEWKKLVGANCDYRNARIWCVQFLAKWYDAQFAKGLMG